MWICPKCGREFARTNQGHYCGKSPETVDEYVEGQPAEAQAYLTELRRVICEGIPGVKERIAWSMPRYEKGEKVVSFAACKKHISLYIDGEVLEKYRSHMDGYVIKKNAVYLPYDKELPLPLIEMLVKENLNGSV